MPDLEPVNLTKLYRVSGSWLVSPEWSTRWNWTKWVLARVITARQVIWCHLGRGVSCCLTVSRQSSLRAYIRPRW